MCVSPGGTAERAACPSERKRRGGTAFPRSPTPKSTCRSWAAARGSTKRGQPGLSTCPRCPAGEVMRTQPPGRTRPPPSRREGTQRRRRADSVPSGGVDQHPPLPQHLPSTTQRARRGRSGPPAPPAGGCRSSGGTAVAARRGLGGGGCCSSAPGPPSSSPRLSPPGSKP